MKRWIEAARPKTLIASLSPVLIGTAMAAEVSSLNGGVLLATLLFALTIQVGTNFANDYIDCVKGSDTKERKGPRRLVSAGLISVAAMRRATFILFSCSALLGSYLMAIGGWPIGLLALLAICLGYLYTGGPCPLAYLGLGDLFVLLFFGPVAVGGAFYLQTQLILAAPLIGGLGPGLISTALLALNNVRDREEDKKARKRTLPVRFGKKFGMWECALCLTLGGAAPLILFLVTKSHPGSLIATATLLLIFPLVRALFRTKNFAPLFPQVGRLLTLYTLLFIVGWLL